MTSILSDTYVAAVESGMIDPPENGCECVASEDWSEVQAAALDCPVHGVPDGKIFREAEERGRA